MDSTVNVGGFRCGRLSSTAKGIADYIVGGTGRRVLVVCKSTAAARAVIRETKDALSALGAELWHQTSFSLRLRENGHDLDPSAEAVRFGMATDGGRWDRVVFWGLDSGAFDDVEKLVDLYTSRLAPDGIVSAIDCGEWLDPLIKHVNGRGCKSKTTLDLAKLRQGQPSSFDALRRRIDETTRASIRASEIRGCTVSVTTDDSHWPGDRNEVVTPEESEKAQALGIANGFRCPACRGLIGDADARPGRGRERLHASCWRAIQMHDVTDAERARLDGAYREMDAADAVIEPSEWPPVGARVRRDGEVWTVGARMGHAAVIVLGDRKRMVLATDCEAAGGQGGGLAAGPSAYHEYRDTIRRIMGETTRQAFESAMRPSDVTRVPGLSEDGAMRFNVRFGPASVPVVRESPAPHASARFYETRVGERTTDGNGAVFWDVPTGDRLKAVLAGHRDSFMRKYASGEVERWHLPECARKDDVMRLWHWCLRGASAVSAEVPFRTSAAEGPLSSAVSAYHDGSADNLVVVTVRHGNEPPKVIFAGLQDQARRNLADIATGALTADWLVEHLRGA